MTSPRGAPVAERNMQRWKAVSIIGASFVVLSIVILGQWGVIGGGFLPSDLGKMLGWGTIGIGILLGAALGVTLPSPRSGQMSNGAFRFLLLSIGTPMLLWIVMSSIERGATELLGVGKSQAVTIDHWRSYGGRGSCAGPSVKEEAPLSASICLDPKVWEDRLPEGSKLMVTGPSTLLGMVIRHVSLPEATTL